MALGAEEPPTGLQSYFCLTKQHKNLSWSLKATVNKHPLKYRHLSKKWISLLNHFPIVCLIIPLIFTLFPRLAIANISVNFLAATVAFRIITWGRLLQME